MFIHIYYFLKFFKFSTEPWVISRDNWHKCRKTGSKKKPCLTSSENVSWDTPLPTLRLDPTAYTVQVLGGWVGQLLLGLAEQGLLMLSTRRPPASQPPASAPNPGKELRRACWQHTDPTVVRVPLGTALGRKGAKLTPKRKSFKTKNDHRKFRRNVMKEKESTSSSLLEKQCPQASL